MPFDIYNVGDRWRAQHPGGAQTIDEIARIDGLLKTEKDVDRRVRLAALRALLLQDLTMMQEQPLRLASWESRLESEVAYDA